MSYTKLTGHSAFGNVAPGTRLGPNGHLVITPQYDQATHSNCYDTKKKKFVSTLYCESYMKDGKVISSKDGSGGGESTLTKAMKGFFSIFSPQQQPVAPPPGGAAYPAPSSGMPSWVWPVAIGGAAVVAIVLLKK